MAASHDEYGPCRLAQDPERDAAKERSGKGAVSARPDHDEVDAALVPVAHDLLRGRATKKRRRGNNIW